MTHPSTPGPELEEPNPEHVEEKLAEESPEGRPAHPEYNRARLLVFAMLVVITLLVVALIVAITVSTAAGITIGILAILALVCNPAFWATIARAQERAHIDD